MQKPKLHFDIKKGSFEEVVQLSGQLPEFANPHDAKEYERRLLSVPHLILVAYDGSVSVGFKVGYERQGSSDGLPYFYSWMGGVLPAYRRKGIAQALAIKQEEWARQQNYPHITFKTRNRHRSMLLFGISRGFQVIGFEPREEAGENRVILRKML